MTRLDDYRRETGEIKAQLLARIGEIAAMLLPHGRKEGGLWVSHNPAGDDHKKNPALKVRINGGDAGAWSDWRSGDKGDVWRLIEHCQRTDFNGARRWAMDALGLKAMSREERAAAAAQAQNYVHAAAAKAEKDSARKLLEANRLWNEADAKSSPWRDHALAYFSGRSCALEDVPNIARQTFRYSRQSEYWKLAKWESSGRYPVKIEAGPLFPAIHSAMRNRMGLLTACHVTFLDPVLPKKALVKPPKMMKGQALGAVIELAYGPENRPFWEAERPHPLIIAEGVETALSLAIEVPEARVWAGGSLAGIGSAPVDLDCISAVIFARDNNVGNDQAQGQFEAAFAQLAAKKPLEVMASHLGDDFNDLANGEAR